MVVLVGLTWFAGVRWGLRTGRMALPLVSARRGVRT